MSNNTQRYEIVAPMPYFTHLMAMDILVPKYHPLVGDCWGKEDEEDVSKWITFCPDYPHLFRPLKWWEHVPVDEFPKYVKCKYKGWDGVYKVGEWVASVSHKGQYYTVLVDGNNGCQAWGHICVPATEQEYNDYITKQNSK